MLHELLKGIHSACSFKFLIIGFNPFLNSGFSRYCFLCGNKCRSLRLTPTEIAYCAQQEIFHQPIFQDSLFFFFFSAKVRQRESFIFMKTEAWTLLSISSPKGVREILARLETCVKIAQNPSCKIKNN